MLHLNLLVCEYMQFKSAGMAYKVNHEFKMKCHTAAPAIIQYIWMMHICKKLF